MELQDERVSLMMSSSPETLKVSVDAIIDSLKLCAPFLEGTLLAAYKAEPKRVEDRIMTTTTKVLTAPIIKEEWEWFRQFLLSSSVWFMRSGDDEQFLYQKMIETATGLSKDITAEMDAIYEHLEAHKDWKKLMAIKEETFVSRQDDDAVGLLKDDGILSVLEMKQQGDDEESSRKLREFVESNVAVTKLTATAKRIDSEFQGVMKSMMTRYGEYKKGPIKKVERCVSKLENDYQVSSFLVS